MTTKEKLETNPRGDSLRDNLTNKQVLRYSESPKALQKRADKIVRERMSQSYSADFIRQFRQLG